MEPTQFTDQLCTKFKEILNSEYAIIIISSKFTLI